MFSRRLTVAVALVVTVLIGSGVGASSALAESHPFLFSFGSLSDPNGIAIDQSSGDVYVADIGTDTVYKFDANGDPVDFASLGSNALTGAGTPAKAFSFPSAYGNPAAIAVDNSTSPSDPSAGDLYVMDAGHDVIDKFSPSGAYLSQITSSTELGVGIDANGDVRIYNEGPTNSSGQAQPADVDVFDDSTLNRFVARQLDTFAANANAGVPGGGQGHGFTVGPTGDDYFLYEGCSCMMKFGPQLATLGGVDNEGSGDVAVAADPATGHLYVDDQSSVAEWDTGAMNGE